MCGYPERFAKEALGHESNAVHWAYAKKANVEAPPLEEYEKRSAEEKLIVLQLQKGVMLAATDYKQNSSLTHRG